MFNSVENRFIGYMRRSVYVATGAELRGLALRVTCAAKNLSNECSIQQCSGGAEGLAPPGIGK